jgi:hypothetical protein
MAENLATLLKKIDRIKHVCNVYKDVANFILWRIVEVCVKMNLVVVSKGGAIFTNMGKNGRLNGI